MSVAANKPTLPLTEIPFSYRNRSFQLDVGPGWQLALYCQGCLRKQRQAEPGEPLFVWTNVELEWEEHHMIEARMRSTGAGAELKVTINGKPLFDRALATT